MIDCRASQTGDAGWARGICIVFCAFTPGNHVNTDGFELPSAQSHGIYEVFLKSAIFSAFRAPRPQKVDIYAVFATLRHVFSRSKFVKALKFTVFCALAQTEKRL